MQDHLMTFQKNGKKHVFSKETKETTEIGITFPNIDSPYGGSKQEESDQRGIKLSKVRWTPIQPDKWALDTREFVPPVLTS